MYIDTHCHISGEYYDDIDLLVSENLINKVGKVIVCGCDKESIEESLKLVEKYDELYLTIGYHPEFAGRITDNDLVKLKEQLKSNKIVGIGEIGLDYHYVQDNKELQKELFEKQLKMAEELNLPIVVHSRDATKDTIDILKKYNLKGVIHCFSGSVESAQIYVSMGYKIGIGGVVTFKNSNLYRVVENVGIDNIVLETDAPYLAPVPFRGQKNSSKYIPYIAEKVAEILVIDKEKVAEITSNNAIELFDLD